MVTASEALRKGYHHGGQPLPQQAESESQTPYSAPEPYQQAPTSYSDSIPSTNIPTTTLHPPQLHQHTYNIQPPPPSTNASSQQQPQPQQYENTTNNIAYQIPIETTSPSTTTPQAPSNHASMTFLPNQPAYPQQHRQQPYPPQTATPIYAPPPTMASYPPTNPDSNFSSPADIYSIAPGMWPTSIVQFQNGRM